MRVRKILLYGVLLCAPALVCPLASLGVERAAVRPEATGWQEAEREWKDFSLQAGGSFVEITDARIVRYFQNHRFFARDNHLYALAKDGQVSDLGLESWISNGEQDGYFRNRTYSTLLKLQRIAIPDESTAIEVVRLTRDLLNAPTVVASLRSNTQNYQIFSRQAYQNLIGCNSWWSYQAKRTEDSWLVTIAFVGPAGVSVMGQPTWEILTDDKGVLVEVRQQHAVP